MSSEPLRHLQQMTGHPVPDNYIVLLNSYPPLLLTARRASDDSDSEGFVSEVELPTDLSCILALNEEARLDMIAHPDGGECVWPDQFLIIGEDGRGDYYCIDASGEFSGVMQYNHHEVNFDDIAVSLDDFVEQLTETFCDADETGDADAE